MTGSVFDIVATYCIISALLRYSNSRLLANAVKNLNNSTNNFFIVRMRYV